MARTANPMTKILKSLEQLKAKSAKLNEEIEVLSELIAVESNKTSDAAPSEKAPNKKSKSVKKI